jgi:hypothetical protein
LKRIFVPTQSGTDWQRLLAKPKLHWKTGASAMTAAASWEDAKSNLPKEIETLLSSAKVPALVDLKLLAAIPEWEVSLPGGETTSNTDVMAICSNDHGLAAVAVEAKVLEPFGPRIGEKRDQASTNQLLRLEYLHHVLKVSHFHDNIRYQLLHRTASAILTAQDFHAATAVMLVHAFSTPIDRQKDFLAFCEAMGGEEIGPSFFRVPTFSAPSLYLAWCNGNEKYRESRIESAL